MLIKQAVGPYPSIREARCNGRHVIAQRDEAITICMPYVSPIVGKLMKLPGASRVEREDLESAGTQGLIEAIDLYEYRRTYNDKPIALTTVLYAWIRKRINEERETSHWAIMKPSQHDARLYMVGRMDQQETDNYINMFVRPAQSDLVNDWDD